MTTNGLDNLMWYSEPFASMLAILVIYRWKLFRDYIYIVAYLGTKILAAMLGAALESSTRNGFNYHQAYKLYFYVYWGSYALEAILGFMVIYSIYNLAMRPLKGLQKLGRLMFRWAAGIAAAVSISAAFAPHLTQYKFIIKFVTQLQETESILTLCLLLFVVVTASPMGLSYKSRIFGVSLGLGLIATMNLIGAAWITQQSNVYGLYTSINSSAIFLAIGIWIVYFAKKEPVRRMIVLPTTSPFLRWNQISAVLNDEPGFVVISEVTSDLFAPAELEVMRRASLKISPSGIEPTRSTPLEVAAS